MVPGVVVRPGVPPLAVVQGDGTVDAHIGFVLVPSGIIKLVGLKLQVPHRTHAGIGRPHRKFFPHPRVVIENAGLH